MPSERKTLHLPLPRFCMQSKCNTHPLFSLPALQSANPFWAPPRRGVYPGDTSPPRPRRGALGGLAVFLLPPVSAPETSTPGEGGGWRSLDYYPSCPREGTRVRAGLAGDLQELGTVGGSGQGPRTPGFQGRGRARYLQRRLACRRV